jgi:cystathionine beta-lyase
MGSLTTRDVELHKQFSYHHRVHGYTVSPFSAMLVSRGLESLKVRLAAQGENAKQLVELVKGCEQVFKINYIDASEVKALSGSNGLFSVELDRYYSDSELEELFLPLTTFKIGESWGGTRSLVLPFQPSELQARFVPPTNTIIRFQSGLEDLGLQIADIKAFVNALSEKKVPAWHQRSANSKKGYSHV